MGSLAMKYGILLAGQIIDGIAALVHAQADKVPTPTTPTSSAAMQAIAWFAGLVVTFIGGKLLRNHPAKGELAPTPVEDDPNPPGPEVGKAAGEAAAKASAATRPKG